jgi:hypothetical protein
MALALVVVAFSSDPEKFCTLPDHDMRCSESHAISLHHRDTKNASSPSDLRTACHGIRSLLSPCDHLGQLCVTL